MVICRLKNKFKCLIQEIKKNPKKITKNPYFYLICILIFALFLRLYLFVGMGFYDDPTYLNTAYKIYSGVEHIPNKNFWELRAGVYYPIAFFWEIFGISEISSSIFFILCSLGSIAVTYFIAKEFFSKKIALFSAFLLSIFPINIMYSSQIGPDIPFQFLSGLAILFFIYHEKNRKYSNIFAILSGVFIGIAYTVKSIVILLIPLFIIYFLIQNLRKKNLKKIFNVKNGFYYFLIPLIFLIIYLVYIQLVHFSIILSIASIILIVLYEIIILKEKNIKNIFRKKHVRYFLILLGFLIIFSIHLYHFYEVSGEWYFIENSRSSVLIHGGNENDNYYWYPVEMFALESDLIKDFISIQSAPDVKGGYFEGIHDPPMFGFLYYFVVAGSIYFIFKRKTDKIFLILWWLGFFFFFEFFIQFYCTQCVDYCVYPRVPRFLTAFSIPAVILAGGLLYFNPKKIKKFSIKKKITYIIKIICIIFLISTSLLYAYQGSTFLRNGMGDIREAAEFLQTQPAKDIYVTTGLFNHKAQFFFKYNKNYTERIKYFNCDEINCNNPFYDSGEYISDAYVILESTPYWINQIENEGYLPYFCKNPPDEWILIKEIDIPNYGIFKKYNPRIYYAPLETN